MKCECGVTLEVGDWPYCPHGRSTSHKGFDSYYDDGLGQTVTGWGDINKACRPKWHEDHVIQIQPRDKSPQYFRELNERRRERAARRER